MTDLTMVCVTKVEPYSPAFLLAMQDLARQLGCEFVIGADGAEAFRLATAQFHYSTIIPVQSKGYLESVHDEVVSECSTHYVLRLDDDEKASPAMVRWLHECAYRASDHWKFPRANMWTSEYYIDSPQLWPDHQTRLSIRDKALGRTSVHCGSPFGGGRPAPVAIEHYKFVVKSFDERKKIAETYDQVQNGLGTGGMLAFNLPELVYEEMPLKSWGDGTVDVDHR